MTDKPDDKGKGPLEDLLTESDGKKPPGDEPPAKKPDQPTETKSDLPEPPAKDAPSPRPEAPPPPSPPPPPPPRDTLAAKPGAPPLPQREDRPSAAEAKPPLPMRDRPAEPSPPPLPQREPESERLEAPPTKPKEEKRPSPPPKGLPVLITAPAHLVLLVVSWFVLLVGIWSNWPNVGTWLAIALTVAPAVAIIPALVLWQATSWTFKTGLSCLMAVLITLTLWAAPLDWWKGDQRFHLLGYPGSDIILILMAGLVLTTILLWWGVFRRFKIVAAVLTVISLYAVYPLVYALAQGETLVTIFEKSAWVTSQLPWWIDPMYILFEVVFPLGLIAALLFYFIRLFGPRRAGVYLWTFLVLAAASATGFAAMNTLQRQGKVLPHLLSQRGVARHLKIPSLTGGVLAAKRLSAEMLADFSFVTGLTRSAGGAAESVDRKIRDDAKARQMRLQQLEDMKRRQMMELKKLDAQIKAIKGQESPGAKTKPPGTGSR
ncbi:MAG: hypothetical protein KJ621_00295 [Proteobacteria bacterium]|nr:hypothetical protein [Pseudomonadota bacterium]MBU1742803.1 hypothetical protein [Pseudomonadota bacterium]